MRKITLPIIWPSIVGVGVLFFMRGMVTLAAGVFLFSPTTQLAAISVLLLEDRGATNQAAAFSCAIVAIVVGSLLAAHLLLRLLGAPVQVDVEAVIRSIWLRSTAAASALISGSAKACSSLGCGSERGKAA